VRLRISILIVSMLITLSAIGQEKLVGFRAYALGSQGSLQLSAPRAWNDQLEHKEKGAPTTIVFTPENGANLDVQITVLVPGKQTGRLPTEEEIKNTVTRAADGAKPQALEKAVPVQEIQGAFGSGYYFTVTDRAPKPAEFKHMTRGMMNVSELVIAFTILSNDGAEMAVADAMKMLKQARQIKAAKR
jgi:hypothetical protein